MVPAITLNAQDYAGAFGEIFFKRSPSFSQQTFDSDIRLRSMAGLSLPIEDEANTVGLFKYIGSSAGLPLDYQDGKLEAQYAFESGTLQDTSRTAENYVGDINDDIQSVFSGLLAYNRDVCESCEDTFIVYGSQDRDDADYTRNYLNAQAYDGQTNSPRYGTVAAGYGHRQGNFLAGILASHASLTSLDMQLTDTGVSYFYLNQRKATRFAPNIGYRFHPGANQELIIAGGPEFNRRTVLSKYNDPSYISQELNVDGFTGRLGALYTLNNSLRAALSYDGGKLSGDGYQTIATTDKGDADIKTANLKSRVFFRQPGSFFSLGAKWERAAETIKRTAGNGVVDTDAETTASELGVGAALYLDHDDGLIGFEYTRINQEDKDGVTPYSPDTNEKRKGFQTSLGAQYRATDRLWLRGGIKRRTVGEDPIGNAPKIDTKTNEMSLGVEFRANKRTSFTVAYTHIEAKSGSALFPLTSTVDFAMDANEYKGDLFEVLLTQRFGSEIK